MKRINESRPNREVSAHKKRRTLEDQEQAGLVNMVGTPDPNRYYHVVNDKGNAVARMVERGYDVEDGKTVSLGDANPKEVGSVAQATSNPNLVGVNGASGKAVLMSIPRKYKEEDDAYRQSIVDKTEEKLHDIETEKERYGKIKQGNE